MRLRSKLVVTVVVQALSVAATALLSAVVAHRYGPEGQGYLSRFRSLVDLLMSVGLFGFPQAFVFLLNDASVAPGWTMRFSVRYSVAFGGLACFAGLAMAGLGRQPVPDFGASTYMALAAGATFMVLHGLYRSVSLATRSVLVFNLMSIVPAVVLLGVYLLWRPSDHRPLVAANAMAGGTSALVGFLVLRNVGKGGPTARPSRSVLKTMLVYGFWTWIPGVAVTAQTAGSFALLRRIDPSDASAGYFSAAVLFLNAMVLPLNMAAPVLFDAWSKRRADASVMETHTRMAHTVTGLVLCVAPIAWLLIGPATSLLFGARFAHAIPASRLMLLAALPACQNRLIFPVLLSAGLARSVAVANVLRAVPPLAIMFLAIGIGDPVKIAALAWGAGECLCLVMCGIALAKQTGGSAASLVGLSPSWAFKRVFAHR
jgi:O-antigen/teichoic acid export membrane protein